MFAKLSAALALFTLAAQVVATPPACLIAAIGKTSNPSDVHSICSSPSSVQSYLSANCGDAADDAQSAFISTCKDAGVTVATSSSSGSSTGTSSGFTTSVTSAGAHTTSGAHVTTTRTGLSTSSTSTHSGSSPTGSVTPGTGAASRLGMDIFGMATIGVLGAMLAGAM